MGETSATPPILSKAAVFGHPIHPMLIHFPVALLLALVGADLAFVFTGDPFWVRVALWLSGVGALGGWVASIAGLVDILVVRRIRRLVTAWAHAICAVMMLSLASLNWALRLVDSPAVPIVPWGLALSVWTAAMISLAAYLGGRLVYEHAVGVDTRD